MTIKMNIGTKLGVGFGIVLLSMISIATSAALSLSSTSQSFARTTQAEWQKLGLAQAIVSGARDNAVRNMDLLGATSAEQRADILRRIDTNKANISAALNRLDTLVHLPEDKAALAKTKQARARYMESLSRVAALIEQGDRAEAVRVMNGEMLVVLDAFVNAAGELATPQIEPRPGLWRQG